MCFWVYVSDHMHACDVQICVDPRVCVSCVRVCLWVLRVPVFTWFPEALLCLGAQGKMTLFSLP